MKIVRTYINESIKPEPNTFPFGIKYEGDVVRFIDRETSKVIYAYGRTTGNIVWYEFKNFITKELNTLPRHYNIAKNILNDLPKAKEIILAHHNKFKDGLKDTASINIDEAIQPVKSFKYKILSVKKNPFSFFRFVDWDNNSIIYYQYFPSTHRIRKTSGGGAVIGSDIKDLEHAKEYIIRYEEQQKTNEALQPIKQTFPFKIITRNKNPNSYYKIFRYDDPKGNNTLDYYLYFPFDGEIRNTMAGLLTHIKPNNLEEAKEFILNDWNKNQKVHEGLMSVKQSYPYKVKYTHNEYKFYIWNNNPELMDKLAYDYYIHTGWIFKVSPSHKPIVINELRPIVNNIEKAKQFILDYENK